MRDELLCPLERRVREDRFATKGHLGRLQKVGDRIERKVTLNDVGGVDLVPGCAQYLHSGPATGRRFPDWRGNNPTRSNALVATSGVSYKSSPRSTLGVRCT